MGDMGEVFQIMKEERQRKHAEWHQQNRAIINESGIPYQDRGETLLFRDKIKADFYPSTGRWRSGNKTRSGGAKAFLSWWKAANA